MANSWIIDMRHFLDDDGQRAVRRGTLVPFLGAIVETVSAVQGTRGTMGDVRCRRRPRHQACAGIIDAFIDPDTQLLHWWCPACGDDGEISNWQGTPWDRRPRVPPGDASAGGGAESIWTPAAERAWGRVPAPARVRLLNNVWCVTCGDVTSIALTSASVRSGDLLLRGTCTRCGGPVARVVEEVGRE